MVSMSASLEQSVEFQQTFSPLLMQANHILSLSLTDLEMAISEAIDDNPALELEECSVCPVCGRRSRGDTCASCRSALQEMIGAPRAMDDSGLRVEQEYSSSGGDSDFDPLTIIASADDIREEVVEAAIISLADERDQAVAMIIVDALDERGYLSIPLADIAAQVGIDSARAEAVLRVVQEVAPPGVAARSLPESLQLQVRYLRQEGTQMPAAIDGIIRDHLEDLAAKRIARVARALGISKAQVLEAQVFIHDQLTPHPLQSHQAETWNSPSSSGHVVPDVLVSVEGDKLLIEVPNAIYDRLHTEAFYRAIAKPEPDAQNAAAISPQPDQELVSHAKMHVARAQQFIWAVRQRRQTLLRVAEYVCAYQEAYVRGDARGLRPLTRSDVASALGVHESTCSRAVAGKFIMLPSRKLIPMSDLFAASLSIKHVMQQIIHDEAAAGRALSDAQISERLLDHGIRIARRTVAKYRDQMHILPSTIRWTISSTTCLYPTNSIGYLLPWL